MRFPPLFRGALAPRHPRPAPQVRPPRRDADEFETLFAQPLEDMSAGATLTHVRVIRPPTSWQAEALQALHDLPERKALRAIAGHHLDRAWIDEAL